jgi:hypothetical protein
MLATGFHMATVETSWNAWIRIVVNDGPSGAVGVAHPSSRLALL